MAFFNQIRIFLIFLMLISAALANYCNNSECTFTNEWKNKQHAQKPFFDYEFGDIDDIDDIHKVDFEPNILNALPKTIMQAFKNLEKFIAIQQNISYIDVKAFGGNFNLSMIPLAENILKIIDLSRNKIQTLPSEAFAQAQNLDELLLSHNNIRAIRTDAFKNLEKLEVLALDNNNLTNINTTTFQHLNATKKIDLSDNQLQSVNFDDFTTNFGLEEISLRNNNISSVFGKQIGENLKLIDLSKNNLKNISSIENFTNVETLNLTGNPNLKLSNEDYEKLTKLVNLFLADTDVEVMDLKMLPNFPRLESLSVPAIAEKENEIFKTKFPKLKQLVNKDKELNCNNQMNENILNCDNKPTDEPTNEDTDESSEDPSGATTKSTTHNIHDLTHPSDTRIPTQKPLAKKENSNVPLIVFLVLLAVLVIMVLGYFAWQYMMRKRENQRDAENGNTQTDQDATKKETENTADDVQKPEKAETTTVAEVSSNNMHDVEIESKATGNDMTEKVQLTTAEDVQAPIENVPIDMMNNDAC